MAVAVAFKAVAAAFKAVDGSGNWRLRIRRSATSRRRMRGAGALRTLKNSNNVSARKSMQDGNVPLKTKRKRPASVSSRPSAKSSNASATKRMRDVSGPQQRKSPASGNSKHSAKNSNASAMKKTRDANAPPQMKNPNAAPANSKRLRTRGVQKRGKGRKRAPGASVSNASKSNR